MIKKFIKKVGRGIKKIGKAIGKPFKKLMKTKIGKIIGTIGMMMIGGWMMAGAKTFASTLWTTGQMGTAFTSGMSAMGNAAGASFTSITNGIKGMFGETTAAQKTTSEALAGAVETGATPITTNMSDSAFDQMLKDGKVPTSDITTEAMRTTQDRLLEAGTETASGRIVGDDAFAKVVKDGSVGDFSTASPANRLDFATKTAADATSKEITGAQYLAQDVKKGVFNLRNDRIVTQNLNPKIDSLTGQRIVPEGFTEVSSFGDMTGAPRNLLDKAYDMPFEEIKERSYGYQPFKDTNLPGIIREGTVGEGMALSQALATPQEQYQQGYSDMSGAYAALDVNTENMYTGPTPSMTQLSDGRTSVPSPAVVRGAADYMANTRKAGFVWDTSLLAVNPSNFAIS